MRTNRAAGRVPLPRTSSPVLPAQLFPPPRTAADMAMHEQHRIAEEPERIAFNEHICAAEASSKADPTNEEKALEFRYLIEDYAEHFGDFVPDAAIEPYIMRRNWATERLDGLWTVAEANGCLFSNPGPIEAYMTAASHFHLFSSLQTLMNTADGNCSLQGRDEHSAFCQHALSLLALFPAVKRPSTKPLSHSLEADLICMLYLSIQDLEALPFTGNLSCEQRSGCKGCMEIMRL